MTDSLALANQTDQIKALISNQLPIKDTFSAEFGEIFRFSKAGEDFDLYIEGLFATPPRLYRVNSSTQGLGSDLLESTLKCSWTASTPLSLLFENPSPNEGIYHIGQSFPIYLFSNFPSFTLTVNDPATFKNFQQIKVILTDCCLYQVVEYKNSGYLTAYGSLKSIKSIKTFASRNNCVCITWRGPVDYVQVFSGALIGDLIEKILGFMGGVKYTKTRVSQKMIKEEDVAPEFILKIKIHVIEAEIIETELEMENEMKKDRINALIDLYQKAIEYYSAFGDERFDGYLAKVRGLMGNTEVLRILNEQEVIVERKENNIVDELEQQEIWPENFERKA